MEGSLPIGCPIALPLGLPRGGGSECPRGAAEGPQPRAEAGVDPRDVYERHVGQGLHAALQPAQDGLRHGLSQEGLGVVYPQRINKLLLDNTMILFVNC